jgi:hypothetical protein
VRWFVHTVLAVLTLSSMTSGTAADDLGSPAAIAFTDVAAPAGVAKAGDPGAIAWFDVDNDGDEDLFVAALGTDRLYRNDGAGVFTKLRSTGLETNAAASFGAAVGDYDNDGLLDLFVANLDAGNKLYRNEGSGRFRDVTKRAKVGGGATTASYSAAWADYDRDGFLDLYVANGTQQQTARNFLYRNQGDGTFREVAESAGVDGGPASSLGCAWADFDNDGWPDLYVANFGQPNRLYRNNGDGTFRDRAEAAGVDDSGNGAGAAWGDYDNDGWLDLYLFNTNAGASADRLWRNRGDGTFADVTVTMGLAEQGDGEAVVWADFDNDGWLDLFVVNRSDFSPQKNRLFRNTGGAGFADVTQLAGVSGTGSGQPAAAADYDGDGYLDLYVGNLPGKREELYLNRGGSSESLVVRLVGASGNRGAIGARVTVVVGGMTLTREVSSSSGRSSQNQMAPHFGLGLATGAERVEVRWPSGAVSRLDDVPAGVVEIVEPEA